MNTIIVSDIHLGSIRSNADELYKLLTGRWGTYDRLILNGDIFDDLNFKRLPKGQWNLVSFLRGKSNDIEIVWINGNHDERTMEVLRHLLGIPIVDKYLFRENNVSFMVTHGHLLNPFFGFYKKLENFFIWIYSFLEKFDKRGFFISRIEKYVKDKTKNFALTHAKFGSYDWVICGHSHQPEKDKPYVNCGGWVNELKTWVEVNEKGELTLCRI